MCVCETATVNYANRNTDRSGSICFRPLAVVDHVLCTRLGDLFVAELLRAVVAANTYSLDAVF